MWCLLQSVDTGGAHDIRGDAVKARAGEAALERGEGASPTVADAAGEACAMGAGELEAQVSPCGTSRAEWALHPWALRVKSHVKACTNWLTMTTPL